MFLKSQAINTPDFSIHPSISDLQKSLPEHRSLFLDKDYLMSMEESSPSGLSFRYVCLKKKDELVAAFYFQIINLSSQDICQIVNFEPYSKLVSGLSMLVQKMLFGVKKDKPHYLVVCGNMYLSGDYGILHEGNNSQRTAELLPEAFDFLRKELEKVGKVIAKIAKDFPAENDHHKSILTSRKYHPLVMDPIMKMKIPATWNSFDDYLADLSPKYLKRYSQIKKKITKCEVRVMGLDELIERKVRLDELYLSVQLKSPVRLIMHDSDYLISIAHRLKSKIEFRGIFEKEKLLAFMVGIKDKDHFEAHHIGIDYEYNRSHSLYQNILYFYIEMAIQNKSDELSFGRTALEMKTTVGAVSHPFNAYLKLNNSLLNGIAGHMLPKEYVMDWIPRNPFKN